MPLQASLQLTPAWLAKQVSPHLVYHRSLRCHCCDCQKVEHAAVLLQELLQLLPVRQQRYLLRQLPIELCCCCMLLLLRPQPRATGFELKHQVISFDAVSCLQSTTCRLRQAKKACVQGRGGESPTWLGAAAGSADTAFLIEAQVIHAACHTLKYCCVICAVYCRTQPWLRAHRFDGSRKHGSSYAGSAHLIHLLQILVLGCILQLCASYILLGTLESCYYYAA
jgi:hypothetical protein